MKRTALLLTLLSLSAAAGATDVGQHPAVFAPRSLPAIDASTFIVGHPAGGAPGQSDVEALPAPAAGTATTAAQRATTATPGQAAPRRMAALRSVTAR